MVEWNKDDALKEHGTSVFIRAIRTTLELSRDERWPLIGAFVAICSRTALELAFPFVAKLALDELTHGFIGGMALVRFLAIMAAIKLASIVVDQFVAKRMLISALIRLENEVPARNHAKLLDLPVAYHEQNGTGRNVAKVTKGCDRFVNVLMDLYFNLFPTILYWIFNLILLVWIDGRLAVLLLLPIVPALWLHDRMFRRSLPVWEEWESYKERATAHFFQGILNVHTVQNYVTERKEEDRQREMRAHMRTIDLANFRIEIRYYAAVYGLVHLGYASAIIAGILLASSGRLSVGTLAFVIATGGVTVDSFGGALNTYRNIIRNSVSVERMRALLREPNDLPRNVSRIPNAGAHVLHIDRVSFQYPGREADALSDISLKIEPGSMVAFVGRSGAGKTTLAKLISRMYDVSSGAIRLDGTDIRTLDRDWYRRQFAVVRQDVDLFDAPVRENVTYGNADTKDTEIAEAIRAAHLDKTFSDSERFPDGLATIVGERGVRLSGGERQRVGIARAYLHLLRGARFLILDEATSNLDSEAEHAIQQMIGKLRRSRGTTIIVIAHRLSTVKSADRIYVVEQSLQEAGTHRELLALDGTYAQLVKLQELRGSDPPSASLQL